MVGGQPLFDGDTAAASDVQDLPLAGDALQQAGQPGAVLVRGIVIASVGAGDRVIAGADQLDRIGVREGQVTGCTERR